MNVRVVQNIKKWGNIIWNAPGIRSAAIAVAIKMLVRIGLSAGAATLLLAVAEAVAGGL
ncbi:hypothetical protein [Sphingobium ummariense]|uniref:hypothetical protein n=1 Tax=Sphingobium ummariense TaxID=420994 RepID=UPI0003FDB1FD|nr:hypothetical protein [Sphingobium ummariense]